MGLYHLAWEVETLADLERLRVGLADAGALSGQSDDGTTNCSLLRSSASRAKPSLIKGNARGPSSSTT